MNRAVFSAGLMTLLLSGMTQGQTFKLAPAVAVEAEDFVVTKGWKVVQNGHGNYMVDVIGFNHIGGERLLSLDAKDADGSAHHDVTIPKSGKYRLWVRYEYPAFCEARFRVAIEQGGKTVFEKVMGTRTSLRHAAFSGTVEARAQHDPPWGPEGLMEEAFTINQLGEGKARITLHGVPQPQTAGVAASRNVDLVYLTSDADDAWLKHYGKSNRLYPILDAFRDTRGPRWEVRFTNRGGKPADYRAVHTYNRIPWGNSEPGASGVKPGASSAWVPLAAQDTAHFGMTQFTGPGEFTVEVRPTGGKGAAHKFTGSGAVRVYLPPYPGKGDVPTTPEDAINAVLADLKEHPAPGKKPTLPLCFGGWMPLGLDNEYGRKYAELYVALGFRGMHPANSGPEQRKNLEALGVGPGKSWMVMGYRNPPTKDNVARARTELLRLKLTDNLRFYDYGDEIHFSEWLGMMVNEEISRARAAGKRLTPREVTVERWLRWLKTNRSSHRLQDYWLSTWGPFDPRRFRPDSSAEAARLNPRLYVDSLLFYEEEAIRFAADGAKGVKAALGDDVLCGANYSGHPFYYPHLAMYVKWFRAGAADLGRHSEYFWQVAQAGPMVNGYVAEHFMAGMRENPKAVLRQYTMPHAPGNTDASFLRTAFSHLAHGATMLDFFGVGMNETFTENHIDHRAVSRFRALRDVTHAVGFVEDVLPKARPARSEVALLISESTERWDHAGTAKDQAGNDSFGPAFRKTRLHFHLERLGIWKALTFAGNSPDLVTEEDVIKGKLAGYKLLVAVGDHWAREMVPALEKWVKGGGTVLGTAGSGQKDSYGEPVQDWHNLAGITRIATRTRTTFIRPRQELPFLEPLDAVEGEKEMPALATLERFEVGKDVRVIAKFKSDGKPAFVERKVGKGKVMYVAAHPGLAFLWSGLRPPLVPDRGANTHTVPTNFDEGARRLLLAAVEAAGVRPQVAAESKGLLLDARLLQAEGAYLLPVANYSEEVGQKAKLTVRVKRPVAKVRSAYHGELTFKASGETVEVTLPSLGYGDVLRLEWK